MDKAVWEYQMFADNDRVLVAVSGGADSAALLDLLRLRLSVYAESISLYATYIDLGFGAEAEARCAAVQSFFDRLGVLAKIVRTDIGPYSHSENNRENPCFLCSRMRRKKIFEAAEEFSCGKIVFGHHKDDIVETLLLNMIFGREISTMPPKLAVFQGKYHLLRPLTFVEEILLKKYCRERNLPVFSQACPTDGNSKRQYVKELLEKMESDFHGTRENIFASMKRVKKDYLL
jgi:tRNA 2-thiocytidine biosynthesis protein TtcA